MRQKIRHNRFCHGNKMIWDAAENVGKVEHVEAADGEWRSGLAAGVVLRRRFILFCRRRLLHHGGLLHTKQSETFKRQHLSGKNLQVPASEIKKQTLFVICQVRQETRSEMSHKKTVCLTQDVSDSDFFKNRFNVSWMSSPVRRSAAFNGSKFFQHICDDEHKGKNKTNEMINLSTCKGKTSPLPIC